MTDTPSTPKWITQLRFGAPDVVQTFNKTLLAELQDAMRDRQERERRLRMSGERVELMAQHLGVPSEVLLEFLLTLLRDEATRERLLVWRAARRLTT